MEGHQASHGPAVMSTRGPRSVLGFEKHVRLSWRWIGWTGLPRVRCSEVTRKQDSCPRRHSADTADAGPLPKALGSERWAQVKVGYRETLRSGRGPGSCCCTDVHHVTEKRDVPPMDISRERPSTRRGPGAGLCAPSRLCICVAVRASWPQESSWFGGCDSKPAAISGVSSTASERPLSSAATSPTLGCRSVVPARGQVCSEGPLAGTRSRSAPRRLGSGSSDPGLTQSVGSTGTDAASAQRRIPCGTFQRQIHKWGKLF